MTKNQAAAQVRLLADAVIEQLVRLDNGWDRGIYRDDDASCFKPIKACLRSYSNEAFALSAEFN